MKTLLIIYDLDIVRLIHKNGQFVDYKATSVRDNTFEYRAKPVFDAIKSFLTDITEPVFCLAKDDTRIFYFITVDTAVSAMGDEITFAGEQTFTIKLLTN